MIPAPVASGTWSGLSVYDLTALQALDASNLAQGTPVYVSSMGKMYYLRGDIAPMLPGAVPALGSGPVGATWAPVELLAVTPTVTLAGTLAFGGTTIPNLKAWFKAETALPLFASGAAVTSLADQSGLGSRDLTGVGNPTLTTNSINGRPGIACVAATPSYMRNVATTLVANDRAARTVFFVGKARTVVGGAQVTFRSGVANIFSFEHLFTGGLLNIFASAGATNFQGVLPDLAIAGVPHVWCHSYDGNFATAGANSFPRVQIDGGERGVTGAGFAVAESGTAGFVIGSREDGTNFGWDGEWSEVLIFDRCLAPFERSLIHRYLAAKYGITVTTKINTMCLGDSHFFGTGDAFTLAAGGPRQELFALHSNLLMGLGEFYQPSGGDGNSNRCEGNAGFQSGAGGTGIGGANLVRYVATNPADLFLLMIGTNDGPDLGGITAAQTATNIRAIVDYIGAALPAAKVVVIRSPFGNSTHGANNAVVLQQGPATETALIGATNILRNPALVTAPNTGGAVIIPLAVPDSSYAASDSVHLSPLGWHQIISAGGTATGLGLDLELRARGL